MQHTYLVQNIDHDSCATITALLRNILQPIQFEKFHVAMAYVTIAGIRDLFGVMPDYDISQEWLVGLDDAITQPGAIELCRSFDASDVRVASFESNNRRFHPKLLYFTNGEACHSAVMMVGSCNLTRQAMATNAESVVLLHSQNQSDKDYLDGIWNDTWRLGRGFTDAELVAYEDKYEKSKEFRKRAFRARQRQDVVRPSEKSRLVLEHDEAEIDPSNADTCWIECGKITAMGRELEFKAEQALFFSLNPKGGKPRHLTFIVSDGSEVVLRMKYQTRNGMWRLQMRSSVPEVAKGLRPQLPNGKLGRSPWVAVFERTPQDDKYRLNFIKLDSNAFRKLRDTSVKLGTRGHTSAREYGWF